jgi:hypothetical protein
MTALCGVKGLKLTRFTMITALDKILLAKATIVANPSRAVAVAHP